LGSRSSLSTSVSPCRPFMTGRLSGRAPRAFKLGKHLRFAASDIAEWLKERHEDGSHE